MAWELVLTTDAEDEVEAEDLAAWVAELVGNDERLFPRVAGVEPRQVGAPAVLSDLWDSLHPEPRMDGSYSVMRPRIQPELVGRIFDVIHLDRRVEEPE